MEKHVLVVFPHPDDETFGCGGTIAIFKKAGVPVTYLCGTLGQMGRNMGRPFFATRESLPHVREAELEEACQALGIDRLIKLGLRDKTVEFEDPEVLADKIGEVIAEVQPSLILTHYPGFAVHPDHNALGAATIRAVARLAPDKRPKVWAHAFAAGCREELGVPDIVNDISSVVDIKLKAVIAHRSQSQVFFSRHGLDESKGGEIPQDVKTRFLGKESFWTYRFE